MNKLLSPLALSNRGLLQIQIMIGNVDSGGEFLSSLPFISENIIQLHLTYRQVSFIRRSLVGN